MTTPSGRATIFAANLLEGHFGRIWLKKDPMRIEINRSIAPVRATISLIHELLHMGEELLKMPLNHVKLHRAAVALYSQARDLFFWGAKQPSRAETMDIVRNAFNWSGIPLDEDSELPMWTMFVHREIAPTVREFTRRLHGLG